MMDRTTSFDAEGFIGSPRRGILLRRRIIGIGVVAASILLLLSLLSYRVDEMGWRMLNPVDHEAASARPCTNWLGVAGLYTAGVFYWLLGGAAVYGAVLLQAPAWGMLLWPGSRRLGQWIGWTVMLLSSCAILSVQPWVLVEWADHLHLTTPGGKLGYLDGTRCVGALFGRTWALIFLLLLHGIALIYYSRITPKLLYRTEKKDITSVWERWRERRRAGKLQQAAAERSWRQISETSGASSPGCDERGGAIREKNPDSSSFVHPVAEELPLDDEERKEENSPAAASSGRSGVPRKAVSRKIPGGNLLDLMESVEDEIERESLSAEDEDEKPPINPYTERAIVRHFGMKTPETKTPAPAPPRPSPAQRRKITRKTPKPESDYPLPPYELLKYEPVPDEVRLQARGEMLRTQARIADTLKSFRISVEPGDITRGPSVTRYEFSVPRGQSVKAVASKRVDIMASTRSPSVNILAPIPGKSTVGVELENGVKEPVFLRELLQSPEFNSPKLRIPVALGKDVYGNPVIGDLAAMPHVLVGGSTGSGKSVCINSMLISFLYKFRPDELKLILVDPKVVEMQPYKKLPHLAVPVVTDPNRVIGALRWAVNEMEHRYRLFSKVGVRNLEDFNNLPPEEREALEREEREAPEQSIEPDDEVVDAIVRDVESSRGCDIPDEDEGEEEQQELDFYNDGRIPVHLPYIVIVVDELADLMMQVKEDLENYIGRLTQKARAAGIHLIVATQSPRAQVVTGIIKTNLPSRIALKVSSAIDSRVILDETGAENLLGRGDLLFLPPGGPSKMTRAQGAFVSDAEIASIIKFCASHAEQNFVQSAAAALSEPVETNAPSGGSSRGGGDSDEELYNRCVSMVITERKASTSLLQRRFSIGYGRAAKIMDMMEQRGVISPPQGASRAREVLIS